MCIKLLPFLLLVSTHLSATQPSIVGRWFGDDESFANSSRVLVITSAKAGTLKSGGFTDALAISKNDTYTTATITGDNDEPPQTVLLILEADGRLRMTQDPAGHGGCFFRNENKLKFAQSLIGNWTGEEAWGTIEESGWATLHLGGRMQRFRLEMTNDNLAWSVRFLNSRQSTPLEYNPRSDTITVKCQPPWTMFREKK